DIEVSIENPAGKLDTTVSAKLIDSQLEVQAAAYRRSTQILMRGYVPLYRASAELIDSMGALAMHPAGY
ncbi:PrpF protein, partial [Pseudomonas sp. MD195_PC81_125]|nr:PrpF protein [Pseudomonas sp. MD195_PC81_125]